MSKADANRIKSLLAAAKELDEITAKINRQLLEFQNSRDWKESHEELQKDLVLGESQHIVIGRMAYPANERTFKFVGTALTELSTAVCEALQAYGGTDPSNLKAAYEMLCDAHYTVVALFEDVDNAIPLDTDIGEPLPGVYYSPYFRKDVRRYSEATRKAVEAVCRRYPDIALTAVDRMKSESR